VAVVPPVSGAAGSQVGKAGTGDTHVGGVRHVHVGVAGVAGEEEPGLVAFSFAGSGLAITSCLKNLQQVDVVRFALLPLVLFSGVLYPVDRYPAVPRA
jgi:hypothetical protein